MVRLFFDRSSSFVANQYDCQAIEGAFINVSIYEHSCQVFGDTFLELFLRFSELFAYDCNCLAFWGSFVLRLFACECKNWVFKGCFLQCFAYECNGPVVRGAC